MSELEYGKTTIQNSYFSGQLKSTKTTYSVPILINDKSQVLTEIIKAIDLITSKETDSLTIIIKADPKTHQFRLLTKEYDILG